MSEIEVLKQVRFAFLKDGFLRVFLFNKHESRVLESDTVRETCRHLKRASIQLKPIFRFIPH